MNIDNLEESIKACRFCFMCRHLSGVGNVTCKESDTPRIRASMTDGIFRNKDFLKNTDYIKTIYDADLSAACRFHCVNKYDENGILLAARRDIVEAGLAPEDVVALVKKLEKSAKPLQISGSGDVLYIEDALDAAQASEIKAFEKLMKNAGIKYRTAKGAISGKAMEALGFETSAKNCAAVFLKSISDSGVKTVVVSNTALYDFLVKDVSGYGLQPKFNVMHAAEFALSLKPKFSKKAGKLYYLESDFLKNYDEVDFPKSVLEKLGAVITPFGTNNEESYTCGEGAVVFDLIRPDIVKKMAVYVEASADDVKSDTIIVASPYSKRVLSKNSKLGVKTLLELVVECL